MSTQTIQMPHPDLPLHIDNLSSIELLESQGWTGPDVDLSINLFEYGFAYRYNEDQTKFFVIYGIRYNDSKGQYTKFDRCEFDLPLDIKKEFDWANFEEVATCHGMSAEDWLNENNIENQISDLFQYYGYENVFGVSHWGGFKIKS
jgi:hypothetical protein